MRYIQCLLVIALLLCLFPCHMVILFWLDICLLLYFSLWHITIIIKRKINFITFG